MSRIFNIQHALLGATVMALQVALANLSAGLAAAAWAGAAQACLSFMVIGINTALFQQVLVRFGWQLAILVATGFAVALAAVVHAVAVTPNYWLTLAIIALAASLNFAFLSGLQGRFGTINPMTLARAAIDWNRAK